MTAASGDGADGLADLRSRLEASPGLGPLTKREIANELEDFMAVARATNAGPPSPGARVALGERFTKLMNRIAGVLKDRDPDLARRLASDRAGLWARIGAAPQAASLP